MCIRKICIKTGTRYPEELDEKFVDQITNEFTVWVTPFTTNAHVLLKARNACKCEDDLQSLADRFRIIIDGSCYGLDVEAKTNRVLDYLGNPKAIYLDYAIGLPGGLGIEEKNGICYFLHTSERRHMPHVHAKYQGEEISIDILSYKVHGEFKSGKKQRQAVEYVKREKSRLLELYNMKTNGIHISNEIVEDKR